MERYCKAVRETVVARASEGFALELEIVDFALSGLLQALQSL
jgi:hypothetical protein